MKPCVVCLCEQYKRVKPKNCKIIQCVECGFNRTGRTWKEAEDLWNGFEVWAIVNDNLARLYAKVKKRKTSLINDINNASINHRLDR